MTEEHPYSIDEIVAYHDAELPEGERAAFEAHLATCAECRDKLDAATVSLGALDDELDEVPPPLDMAEALAALRRGEAASRADRKRRMVVTVAGLTLAAAAALIAALLIQQRAPQPPAPQQQIAPRDQKLPAQRESAPAP